MNFTIEAIDSNEPPVEVTLGGLFAVEEDIEPQTKVSAITMIDEDINQIHSCQILKKNMPFPILTSLNGSIVLVVAGVISYEDKPSYKLTLRCSDGGIQHR